MLRKHREYGESSRAHVDEAEEGRGAELGMTRQKMGTAAETGMGPGMPEYRGMEEMPEATNF